MDAGEVRSVSVTVDVDILLDDDGSAGTEKLLETVDKTDS